MVIKTIFMFSIMFVPYFLILFVPMSVWAMWGLTVIMGIGVAGVGMSVMHDACHGSYSTKPSVNKIMGYSINLLGGNRFSWTVQHNILHHTYTNIYGADDDINIGALIRVSPYCERKWYHRFQHIYAWFLYSFGTLTWVTTKDFKEFNMMYNQKGAKKGPKRLELFILVSTKILFYCYLVLIPYLVLDSALWQVVIGFLTMEFVAGFILTVTFQLAHIVEQNDHHSIDHGPMMPDHFAKHQLQTTANFARKNKILSWYLGGLNFQIEHHLFPNISHLHYPKIADIVKKTAEKHQVRYNDFPTFWNALGSHFRMLKHFGQNDMILQPAETNKQANELVSH